MRNIFTPQNSYMALMVFFSSEEKPISREEMDEFWNSLTPTEKHYYMCADIQEGRRPMATLVEQDRPNPELCEQDPPQWCHKLAPHYHTKKGLVPRQIVEVN